MWVRFKFIDFYVFMDVYMVFIRFLWLKKVFIWFFKLRNSGFGELFARIGPNGRQTRNPHPEVRRFRPSSGRDPIFWSRIEDPGFHRFFRRISERLLNVIFGGPWGPGNRNMNNHTKSMHMTWFSYFSNQDSHLIEVLSLDVWGLCGRAWLPGF